MLPALTWIWQGFSPQNPKVPIRSFAFINFDQLCGKKCLILSCRRKEGIIRSVQRHRYMIFYPKMLLECRAFRQFGFCRWDDTSFTLLCCSVNVCWVSGTLGSEHCAVLWACATRRLLVYRKPVLLCWSFMRHPLHMAPPHIPCTRRPPGTTGQHLQPISFQSKMPWNLWMKNALWNGWSLESNRIEWEPFLWN